MRRSASNKKQARRVNMSSAKRAAEAGDVVALRLLIGKRLARQERPTYGLSPAVRRAIVKSDALSGLAGR